MWFAVTVRRLVTGFPVVLCLAVVGCGRSPGPEAKARKGINPAHHARSVAARTAALRMDHATARGHLGGHRYEARHRVRVTVDGQPDRAFEDRYWLRCTGGSDCYGRQDNSLEYGVEFYRIGEQTYFRHRYQRFGRFAEEPEEARRRVERIWGAGAAVIELLQGHLSLTPSGEATVAGRPAKRYRLSLGKAMPMVYSGRRAWRSRLKAMHIEGEALLDETTGVVLALKVRYAVSVPKSGRTVTITGELDSAVTEAGKPQVIKPPADFAVARARPREARELRMLGSHRLHPGWFRGGGPHAARRQRRGGGVEQVPSMEVEARSRRSVRLSVRPSKPMARSPMARRPPARRPPTRRPRPGDKP
jgi:hypothetical protein